MHRAYGTSDLYILPSVSEPFGITPLEAMAHGVPVIISNQAGVGEVVRGCLKVDFWNVEELAAKIIVILCSSALAQDLRESGLEEIKEITWEHSAQELERALRAVLAAP